MKLSNILLCLAAILIYSETAVCQSKTDSIRVNYSNVDAKTSKAPLYYLNGVLVAKSFPVLDPKHPFTIDIQNKTEMGEVYFTMPHADTIACLTPVELKKKYVRGATKLAIYVLDGKVIRDLTLKIEEAYVLSINVVSPEDAKLDLGSKKISIINILTRSKENLAEASQIKIKGLAR